MPNIGESAKDDNYYCYRPEYISKNKIEKLIFENGVKKIGKNYLLGISKSVKIQLPNSIIEIDESSFLDINKEESVIYGVKDSYSESFSNNNSISFIPLYYPIFESIIDVMERGEQYQCKAYYYSGIDNKCDDVEWGVVGYQDFGTKIDSSGILKIGRNEIDEIEVFIKKGEYYNNYIISLEGPYDQVSFEGDIEFSISNNDNVSLYRPVEYEESGYEYKYYIISSEDEKKQILEDDWPITLNGDIKIKVESYKIYYIKFDVQDGITNISDKKIYFGEQITELPEPIREGYEFGGWFTNDNVEIKEGYICNGDLYVMARWEKIERYYPSINISYRTHIQSFGWEGDASDIKTWKSNGTMSGTSGKAKRLEGINIVVNSAEAGKDVELGIQYTTHCQSYGWLPWSADGDMNGTEGEAKRLEAIKIQLTGADKDAYDVYYRVHAQSYGWLGWAKNGAPSGTAGYGKRLEGIQIVVVKKGESFNQKMEGITSAKTEAYIAKEGSSPIVNFAPTSNTNPVIPGADTPNVAYRTHVQSFGWQGWKYNGQMSGTSGLAKRLEGININLTNKPYDGDIVYTTHIQSYGWKDGKPEDASRSSWKKNGAMSGTSGEAKRLEAICIDLTGEMGEKYDIYYRVHAQSFGWLGWACNGQESGTAGYAKRLEGIQIVLVPKGGKAPANDFGGVTSVRTERYIEK